MYHKCITNCLQIQIWDNRAQFDIGAPTEHFVLCLLWGISWKCQCNSMNGFRLPMAYLESDLNNNSIIGKRVCSSSLQNQKPNIQRWKATDCVTTGHTRRRKWRNRDNDAARGWLQTPLSLPGKMEGAAQLCVSMSRHSCEHKDYFGKLATNTAGREAKTLPDLWQVSSKIFLRLRVSRNSPQQKWRLGLGESNKTLR